MAGGSQLGIQDLAAINMELTDYFYGNALRELCALALVFTYSLYCVYRYRQHKLGASVASSVLPRIDGVAHGRNIGEFIQVVFASQTGQAQSVARETALQLSAGGRSVRLNRIDEPWLRSANLASHVLFVVSTSGEGSSPDHAARFVRDTLLAGSHTELKGVPYGLLALGDRSYPEFCAFGRQLDQWLQNSGAHQLFPRMEADRLEERCLDAWTHALTTLGAKAPAGSSPRVAGHAEWLFVGRSCLNQGSPGAPVFKVQLKPVSGNLPHWKAGDLVDVILSGEDDCSRTYSISNLPDDGLVELIVRTSVRDDGQLGLASGWLNHHADANDTISLRIRSNPAFNLDVDAQVPLILIGAGVGLAGLRAHLKSRAIQIGSSSRQAPERCAWLFFGERSTEHDRLCQTEIEEWMRTKVLTKTTLSFSRDEASSPYVQHALIEHAPGILDWVEAGASILICGSAKTMAKNVDAALRTILGSDKVDELLETGRIRRDVF